MPVAGSLAHTPRTRLRALHSAHQLPLASSSPLHWTGCTSGLCRSCGPTSSRNPSAVPTQTSLSCFRFGPQRRQALTCLRTCARTFPLPGTPFPLFSLRLFALTPITLYPAGTADVPRRVLSLAARDCWGCASLSHRCGFAVKRMSEALQQPEPVSGTRLADGDTGPSEAKALPGCSVLTPSGPCALWG